MRRVLITGASGYIGRRLLDAALGSGWEVLAAVRRPESIVERAGLRRARLDLTDLASCAGLPANADAVIHLAAILDERSQPNGVGEDLNVAAARALLDASRNAGVGRFVFVSSQSAAEDSPTRYGRQKWRIEQLLEREGEIAVRLGLVSGGAPRGVYGQLLRLTRRSALLPVLRPGAAVYPIHVVDVCRALLAVAGSSAPPRTTVWLGASTPTAFGDYLRLVARERVGRRLRLVRVPLAPVLAVYRLLRFVPRLPRPDEERVRGLAALRPVDTQAFVDAAALGLPLRDVGAALACEGRRRRLIAEGRAVASYVVGHAAEPGVVRRYVRAVEHETDPQPLDLPSVLSNWPRLIRLVEPPAGTAPRFTRRLELATRIAEMTPGGARAFHQYESRPRWRVWLSLTALVVGEAVLLVLRATFGRILLGRDREPIPPCHP